MSKTNIQTTILDLLQNSEQKTFTVEQLNEQLGFHNSQDFKLLVQTLAKMEQTGLLSINSKGRFRLAGELTPQVGIFSRNERGYGFVRLPDEEHDVYIAPEDTLYALDQDEVVVEITKSADARQERGAEGKITKIEKRHLEQAVGAFTAYQDEQVEATGLYGYVTLKDKKLKHLAVFVISEGIRPVDGDMCIVSIQHYPDAEYPTAMEGYVTSIIGHEDDPGMDILEIVYQHGIPVEFSEAVTAQTEKISDKVLPEDWHGRKDLTTEIYVTIDGESAKDLDDAVTVRKLSNGHYFLGVSIADVSYYVTENSALDDSAYERGTSVYLTDRVIPMLPHKLSNGICSLNPQVERLAMTCEMEIDQNGGVIKHQIFPSVIKTAERMTYTTVNEILTDQDKNAREKYADLVPMFEEMAELHHILEAKREKRGAVQFDDREAEILVDNEGHPLEIMLRQRGVGERMIESFMLAANETVAEHFAKRLLPFLYRIHEAPESEKMLRFFEFVTNFGILVKGSSSQVTPKMLQGILDDVAGKPEEAVVSKMLLRGMQQAKYAAENRGHFGLAAEYYTHFTSPIRRYPDLIVHRLIRAYHEKSVPEKVQAKWAAILPDIAEQSSRRERRSVEAERDTDALKKAEFMQDKIGEIYDGVISSVTRFGMFIELPNTVEGLIHISKMKEDYFNFIENHMALVGERTGLTYRIGQKVQVKVVRVDIESRIIDFEIAGDFERDYTPVTVKKKKSGRRTEQKTSASNKYKSTNHQSSDSKPKRQRKNKSKGKKPFYQKVAKQNSTGKGKK